MTDRGFSRRIHERGRVTIPAAIRDDLELAPGDPVRITERDGQVVLEPRVSREEFIRTMEGVITSETERTGSRPTTPEGLKDDWTADLPDTDG